MDFNVSILPWYSAVSKQNHRKDYAYDGVYPLITPDKSLLPFQIVRATSVATISSVKLYTIDGVEFLDITSAMATAGLQIKAFATYDLIVYAGTAMTGVTTPEGRYYAVMTDGTTTWYSEVFNIVASVTNYLKIEYYNRDGIYWVGGHIEYYTGYKNVVYLDTQLGMPEYTFNEEAEERDGHTFVENQISEKKFKFVFIAPEYLLDAMRLIRLNDYITITCKGISYTVETFLITPKWLEGGYLASVEAEFECDTVVKKIGAIYYPTGQEPSGYIADFSNMIYDEFVNADLVDGVYYYTHGKNTSIIGGWVYDSAGILLNQQPEIDLTDPKNKVKVEFSDPISGICKLILVWQAE